MGSKISIDKYTSNIEDILEMNASYFNRIKYENQIPDTIKQHIKLWKYYEDQNQQQQHYHQSRNIKTEAISLQTIQTSNFSFNSNECYLVLFIYRKGIDGESCTFTNFPHSIWGLIESYSNLTPRGLEVPAATSEPFTNLQILESFLIPKIMNQVEERKFEYMIFVWNGKTANALLKSLALSAAFELETLLNKAKDPLLQVLFSGGVIKNKKLQKGTILQLNSHVNKNIKKEYEKQFNAMRQTIYLLKFLFPSMDNNKQAQNTNNFNRNFLISNKTTMNDSNGSVQPSKVNNTIALTNNDDENGSNDGYENHIPDHQRQNCKPDMENLMEKEPIISNPIKHSNGSSKPKLPALCLSIMNSANYNNKLRNDNVNISGNPCEQCDNNGSMIITHQNPIGKTNSNPKLSKPIIPTLNLGIKKNDQGTMFSNVNPAELPISSSNNHYASNSEPSIDYNNESRPTNFSKKMAKLNLENIKSLGKCNSNRDDNNSRSHNTNTNNNGNGNMASSKHSHRSQTNPSKAKMKSLPLNNLKDRDIDKVIGYEHIAKELEDGMIDDNIGETQRKKIKIDYFSQICNDILPDFLYVGGEQIAYNYKLLKEIGITNIINCAGNVCENKFTDDIHYLTYYLKDQRTENIECIFYESIKYIEQCFKNKGKVLVHCVQGVSRSIAICMAYLIYKYKYSYEDAYERARKARAVASPNMGFIVQLIMFQKRLQCPYDALPGPRIFCVGSHQKETPSLIVARLLLESLYCPKNIKYLDPRTVFIIQVVNKIYIWIGNSINHVNQEAYLNLTHDYIRLLQENEHAAYNIETIYQENEPNEFWSIWGKEPITRYGLNSEWDTWFIDISKHENVEGPTYNRNQEFLEDQMNFEHNSPQKPYLYCFPDTNPLHIFDMDELTDESLILICHEKDDNKLLYIWKGYNFEANMLDQQAYTDDVIENKWPNENFSNVKIIHEIPHQETEEFFDLFSLKDQFNITNTDIQDPKKERIILISNKGFFFWKINMIKHHD